MPDTIINYRITRYQFPRPRVIGDSQVRFDTHHLGTLELETSEGRSGLGFFGSLTYPLPPLLELEREFETEGAPSLLGQSPAVLIHRLTRPRGGNIRSHRYAQAVDQALWDLHAKQLGLPLYRLLGGTEPRVRAYASGLDFHLSDEDFQAFFAQAARQGFTAFKIKVGHPDLQWDLNRVRMLVDVVGSDATVMVDANEAWSPKEAIRRAYAYRAEGFDIFWIEDPCLRDDFAGLAQVAQDVPFSHVITGEYLGLHGKRQLIEARAVDILNVHGHISESLHAAWLASECGLPVSVGNTPFEVGVHIAAALPEPGWMEYSFPGYEHLLEEPVRFERGYAIAPNQPGHGLVVSELARAEYARPDVA